MIKIDELPKQLPDMDAEFEIDLEGNVTKKQYKGSFKVKIPNLKLRANIQKETARLNEGLESHLDDVTKSFHTMVAYLRYTVYEAPQWWRDSKDGLELYDGNVVSAVYIKASQFEESWMKAVWGEAPVESENK